MPPVNTAFLQLLPRPADSLVVAPQPATSDGSPGAPLIGHADGAEAPTPEPATLETHRVAEVSGGARRPSLTLVPPLSTSEDTESVSEDAESVGAPGFEASAVAVPADAEPGEPVPAPEAAGTGASAEPLSLAEFALLSRDERLVLYQLLATGALNEAQAREVLATHRRIRSPLRDVICTNNYIHPRAYARAVAAVAASEYGSDQVERDTLDLHLSFIRLFDPAVLVRHLFCSLRQQGNTVIVLAADPNDPTMRQVVQQVAPGTKLVTVVGTEVDITRLVDSIFQPTLLSRAVHDLQERRPEVSASQVFTQPQKAVGIVLGLAVVLGLVWAPRWTLMGLLGTVSTFYTIFITYKLIISIAGLLPGHDLDFPEEEVDGLGEDDLPLYSVLVPVYKEPKVVSILIKALSNMDYPTEKLDVLLLMEEDDHETIAAAKAAHPPHYFRFIYIPASQPRTKPKACNYGLPFCRGEFVTIYDAEDIPEPDQLRTAVLAFRKGPENLVCVQAALNYFNRDENYLTRMFTLEYSYWFDNMLPGLDRLRLPIPLGGTSNHFRLDRLRELGAWDPYNVTEDADLGIRASGFGYTVGVIRSTTFEEANKAFKNWIRQRSRWIKGYMQTWLVHNRRPLVLLKEIGFVQWISYQLFIGGTCLIFLLNPLMWVLSVWNMLPFMSIGLTDVLGEWTTAWLTYNLVAGNLGGILLNVLAVVRRRMYSLVPFALTNPLYWWMHSIASYMALWQLFTKPFYWEKTDHALTDVEDIDVAALAGQRSAKRVA